MRILKITFLFLILTLQLKSQKVDSLISVFNNSPADTNKIRLALKIAEHFRKEKSEKALEYSNKAFLMSGSVNNNYLKSLSLESYANFYFTVKKLSEGYNYLVKMESLYDETKDTLILLSSLEIRNSLMQDLQMLPKCVEIRERMSAIYRVRNEKQKEARMLWLAGWHAFNGKVYRKGVADLHRSASIYKTLKDDQSYFNALGWLGQNYSALKMFDSALYYRDQVLDYYLTTTNISGIAEAYRYRGDVYLVKRQYDLALNDYEKSIEYFAKAKWKGRELLLYEYKVRVYDSINNTKEALRALDTVKKQLNEKTEGIVWMFYYQMGKRIYFKNGDYQQALYCFNKYDSIKTASNQDQAQQQIVLAEFKKDVEKNEAILKAEFDRKEALSSAELARKQAMLERNKQMYLILEQESKLKEMDLAKSELELKHKATETENQKKQLQLLAQDKQLKEIEAKQKEEELNKQRIVNYAVSSGGLLVAGLLFFAVRGYNQKKKDNKTIQQQKLIVEEKQKEILDSITYAKRLQEAIMPPTNLFRDTLPNSFIYYKPKDIIAGDFYWMERLNEMVFFAAADCTGHGVPGAMVSVVCSNALNRAVKEFGIKSPSKILDKTRELVIETFERSESEVKDGMDISLCALNLKSMEMEWAGANNPLWVVRNKELLEYKADKQPIGKYADEKPYTNHTVNLQSGDSIYVFTDGFADQFGGPKGKKFKYKHLAELLIANSHKSPDEQKNTLSSTFDTWKGNLEQIDDVCVIGLRI